MSILDTTEHILKVLTIQTEISGRLIDNVQELFRRVESLEACLRPTAPPEVPTP